MPEAISSADIDALRQAVLRLTADLQWIIPFDTTKEDILAAGLRLQTIF